MIIHTERMTKVRIIVPSLQLDPVIEKLYSLSKFHLIPHTKNSSLDIGKPLPNVEKISELLLVLRSLKAKFNILSQASSTCYTLSDIETKLQHITQQITAYEEKLALAAAQLSEKNELLKQLDFLNSLYLDIDSYKPLKSIASFIGYINYRDDLRDKLYHVTRSHKLHISKNGKHRTLALFCRSADAVKIAGLLKEYSFTPVDISKALQLSGHVMPAVNALIDEINTVEIEQQKTQRYLQQLLTKYTSFIANAEAFLTDEAAKAEAPLQFAATRHSSVIQAWVPTHDIPLIQTELEKTAGAKIVIEQKPVQKNDKVPIQLKHTLLVKPFTFFMDLYTLPHYDEINPVLFMFLTFPLFFGMMLGDVGYGLVTLLFFLWLKTKLPQARDLLNVLLYSSVSSIIFGFIFGEYFGFEHVKEKTASFLSGLGIVLLPETIVEHGIQEVVYTFPRIINRLHGEINVLGNEIHIVLVLGAILGFIHLNLAFLIGFFNELHHGFFKAVLHKVSWLILEAGIILLVISFLGIITLPILVGWFVLALAIIMLYLGEGVQGLVELPSIFSNILSYMRLGAVGLASVGLAVVVNENLTMPFIEKGGFFVVIGILIFALGHTINILLGILGPFLHSLRLHYVEFFSKFFHGGGIRYAPFGAKNYENYRR
ncbi:V-type ATP synthase subunit I [Candidatus Woesearchaeota archaeon]|nr:V-type ATP synthase subunit I [Candidatus Woesearchaeota archaeon]